VFGAIVAPMEGEYGDQEGYVGSAFGETRAAEIALLPYRARRCRQREATGMFSTTSPFWSWSVLGVRLHQEARARLNHYLWEGDEAQLVGFAAFPLFLGARAAIREGDRRVASASQRTGAVNVLRSKESALMDAYWRGELSLGRPDISLRQSPPSTFCSEAGAPQAALTSARQRRRDVNQRRQHHDATALPGRRTPVI
jgi:hypothetical protein